MVHTAGENEVARIAAGPEYELLHKNSLDEMCMATPAIAGDRLLIARWQSSIA